MKELMTMIKLKEINIGGGNPFVLIAGPCVVENEKFIIHNSKFKKSRSNNCV